MRYAQLVVGFLAFAAALLAIYSASIEVRDSLDTMMADMAEQGRWVMRAAIANAFASALLLVVLLLELRRRP